MAGMRSRAWIERCNCKHENYLECSIKAYGKNDDINWVEGAGRHRKSVALAIASHLNTARNSEICKYFTYRDRRAHSQLAPQQASSKAGGSVLQEDHPSRRSQGLADDSCRAASIWQSQRFSIPRTPPQLTILGPSDDGRYRDKRMMLASQHYGSKAGESVLQKHHSN